MTYLSEADPKLGAVISRVGKYPKASMEPTFHGLGRSIVYQQLSGKAAGTILGRVMDATSNPLTPEAVLKLSIPELRALGLSNQKASYLRDLAERTASGEIEFSRFHEMPDHEIMAELTRVKGVGTWTVQMFLIFALERANVLPVGDLGIRNAVKKLYRLKELPKPDKIEKIAKKWHPYCSVATWYLWRSLELD